MTRGAKWQFARRPHLPKNPCVLPVSSRISSQIGLNTTPWSLAHSDFLQRAISWTANVFVQRLAAYARRQQNGPGPTHEHLRTIIDAFAKGASLALESDSEN